MARDDPGHHPLTPLVIRAFPHRHFGHVWVVEMTRSTSSGQTFSPPVVITSAIRPDTTRVPAQ